MEKTKEEINALAQKEWEEVNTELYDNGGVNPVAFIMGFKYGYKSDPEKDILLSRITELNKEIEKHRSAGIQALGMKIKAIEALEHQNKELGELKSWKESQMNIFLPLLEYGQNHPELKFGDSVSEKLLEFLKERDELKKDIKSHAIKFGKFFANSYNTESMDSEDIEKRIPEIYKEYLAFCGIKE